MLIAQLRAGAQIEALSRALNLWHGIANDGPRGVGAAQHVLYDYGVEHALHGNAFGGGLDSGHAAHAINQGFAVMRAGAADKRSINIEKSERGKCHGN
jgi:hypothetical protein